MSPARRFSERLERERAALARSLRDTDTGALYPWERGRPARPASGGRCEHGAGETPAPPADTPMLERERYASLLLARMLFLRFLGKPGAGCCGPEGLRRASDHHPALEAVRPVELNGSGPAVEDAALERVWEFLADYTLRPNEGHPRARSDVGPEVLGCLLEKQAGRRQTGTYYTDRDVTEYVCAGTIIPVILDGAARRAPEPFAPGGEVWRRLRRDPDRYIHPAVLQGVDAPLPAEVAAGLEDPTRRGAWNEPAAADHALPTETWREHVARRNWANKVRGRLAAGEIRSGDDLLTLNLDLRGFAADVIAESEDPQLVAAFWEALNALRVLDPTCGAGAFLLSALDVLEPLYRACLERMRGLPGEEAHFIRHRILRNNLFGVDLAPEAVEVCRMRLFLKVAAVDEPRDGAVPLPAFNVHVGNALSGTEEGFWRATFPEVLERGGFDVIVGNPPYVPYGRGRLPECLPAGAYRTESCGSLFAPVMERAFSLQAPEGRLGMVVPVAAVSTEQCAPLAALTFAATVWVSTFSNRPGKLFDGVEQRLAIILRKAGERRAFTTRYQHWYQEERATLFQRLRYFPTMLHPARGMPLKIGSAAERCILDRLMACGDRGLEPEPGAKHACWIHDAPTYWVRALAFEPDEGSKGGHYHRFGVPTEEDACVTAAILSSSTFYLFFKAISNCRDLGWSELAAFPVGILDPATRQALAVLGRQLSDELRRTARPRSRVYPSGTVHYHEHFPALARPILDQIDAVLARHYGLTDEELDFIVNLDVKYRMGRW